MACNCIDDMNRLLGENGYEHVKISHNLLAMPKAIIETYETKKVRGKKPPVIQATFCPFCGVKYKAEA